MAAIGYALAHNRVDIDILHPERRQERVAASAAVPGMLVKMDANKKFTVHSTEYGKGELLVVGVDSFRGKDLSDTSYAIGDRMFVHSVDRGDLFLALIKDGQNIAAGDQLVSKGDGTFRKVNATTDHVFAIADDSLDLTAAGANHHVVARAV